MKLDYQNGDSPLVAIAGHICLDILPDLSGRSGPLGELLLPGRLHQIGPVMLSTGGAVANTGLALHRLGVRTRLMGKVGDDAFGQIIRQLVDSNGPGLSSGMVVAPGERTSYSIVISSPGVDRLFLHYSGTNDTFGAADVSAMELADARLFHFGYPPVMRRFYSDGGVELAEIFRRAKSLGLTTSLDMTEVDRRSDAAGVDWPALLRHVLPAVDVFLPSLDEILFMLRDVCPVISATDASVLDGVSLALLEMGAAVVVLKLGDQGLYLRTTLDEDRLAGVIRCAPRELRSWSGRQLLAPCFSVRVAGTTGSGDCTIAGFLAGLLRGLTPEEVMIAATGTGACCVEKLDATTGVPTWDELQRRIRSGWKRHDVALPLPGWLAREDNAIFVGPLDRSRFQSANLLNAEPRSSDSRLR